MRYHRLFRSFGLRQVLTHVLLAVAMLAPLSITGVGTAVAAPGNTGAVYVLGNDASGNAVLAFERGADGSLQAAGEFDTGGLGSGAGLGGQGALVLSANGRWLFAVNAGSNQISVFAVRPNGLKLVDVADSGGETPISLALKDRTLYVLNAGGSGNITGFSVGTNGQLQALPGSTQPLSNGGVGAAPGPAQVSFSPKGDVLVVTEKGTNTIDVYAVGGSGAAGPPVTYPSAGETPFGFAFSRQGTLVVSDAFGGAADASALSSYRIEDGKLVNISAAVPTNQTAACWVVISGNGKYAYTTNAGSGSISSYRIERNGAIGLQESRAGDTGAGSAPIDMAFSHNSQFLYALNSGSHTVAAFEAHGDGSLTSVGSVVIPASASGIAAW
jgi:6-phosphogluconolactonase